MSILSLLSELVIINILNNAMMHHYEIDEILANVLQYDVALINNDTIFTRTVKALMPIVKRIQILCVEEIEEKKVGNADDK